MGNEKRNLILIHGSGGNGAVWAYQSRHFSREHNVFALDLPGHGRNTEPPRTSVADYAEFVTSFIQARNLAAPILIGNSLGGAIALQVVLASPDVAGGLVLVGTGARLRVLPALLDTIKADFAAALALLREYAFSPETPEKLVEKMMQELRKAGPQILQADLTACDAFDVMAEITRITVPTLIVVGRDDRLTPVKYAEYLHKMIATSILEVIPSAGHMVMIEQPGRFNAVLEHYLHNLARP